MSGGEFLQGRDVSEARHLPFSLPERLVRVFGLIVEPAAAFLTIRPPADDPYGAGAAGRPRQRGLRPLRRDLRPGYHRGLALIVSAMEIGLPRLPK